MFRPAISFTALAIAIAISAKAEAQTYRFDSDPYPWANVQAVVIDQCIYRYVGNGIWQWRTRTIRADNGAVVQGDQVIDHLKEISRGPGEVQLQGTGVPVRLTDNGVYIFRNYPKIPVPDGIDPNEQRWWRNEGNGRWAAGRP